MQDKNSLHPDKSLLCSVYCQPEYRGQGHVEKIIRHIIAYHRQHYPDDLFLSVEVNNKPAISLYKKLGFIIDRPLPARLLADGLWHDEFLMKLSQRPNLTTQHWR